MADDQNKALDDLLAAIRARREDGDLAPATSSSWRDLVHTGVSQGLMMGFGDEARAAVGSALGQGSYDEILDAERKRIANTRADRPWQSMGAEVIGGLAPLALTGGAAAPVVGAQTAARSAGVLGQIGRGAYRGLGAGAVGGAVQGFGEGEGGLGNRIDTAIEGGVVGGLAGGVLGGAVPAISAAGRHLRTPIVDRARDSVQRALDADNLTPEAVARDYQQRAAAGAKPELISDLAPESNVSTALEGALNQPTSNRGTIVSAILERGDSQGDRILDDFERVFGSRRGEFQRTFEQLDAARRANARPLYNQAYSHDISDRIRAERLEDTIPDDNDIDWNGPAHRRAYERSQTGRAQPLDSTGMLPLKDILDRVPGRALTYAREQAQMDGATLHGKRWSFDDDDMPSMRDLDFVKRGLDRMVEKDTDALTRRVGSDGYAAQQVKNLLVDWADDATTVNGRSLYGEARANWAGPSAMIDAMEYGRAALRERAEVTSQRVSRMSRSEQDAFLVGVLDAAQQKIGSVRIDRDASGALGMTANSRRAIEAAMGAVSNDPAVRRQLTDRLIDGIQREAQIARTTRTLTGNSRTALRMAAQESERRAGGVMQGVIAESLTTGAGMPGLATGIGIGGRAVRGGLERSSQVAETARQGEIARLLSGMDQHSVSRNMQEVAGRRDALEALLRRRLGRDPMIAGFAGGRTAAGLAVNPQREGVVPDDLLPSLLGRNSLR